MLRQGLASKRSVEKTTHSRKDQRAVSFTQTFMVSLLHQVPAEPRGIPGTQHRDALLFSATEEAGGEAGQLAVGSP